MKPMITKEHGSWAVLLIPVITGIAASEKFSVVPAILYSVSILFLFLSYVPAEILISGFIKKRTNHKNKEALFWLKRYSSVGFISGLVLLIFTGKFFLVLFAFFALIFFIINLFISIKKVRVSGVTLLQ